MYNLHVYEYPGATNNEERITIYENLKQDLENQINNISAKIGILNSYLQIDENPNVDNALLTAVGLDINASKRALSQLERRIDLANKTYAKMYNSGETLENNSGKSR